MTDIGLKLSDDFPTSEYNSAFIHVWDTLTKNHGTAFVQPPLPGTAISTFTEFAGGWNAIRLRFEACTDAMIELERSLKEDGTNPDGAIRFGQDNEIFSFFVSGYSSYDSLHYALYFFGQLINPSAFTADPRGVSVKATIDAYEKAYASDPLTLAIAAVYSDPNRNDWYTYRNIVAHRISPGRLVFLDGSGAPSSVTWSNGLAINSGEFVSRRAWLRDQLQVIISAADSFFKSNLP